MTRPFTCRAIARSFARLAIARFYVYGLIPPDFFDSALMRVTIVTISRRQSAEVLSRMVIAKTHVTTSVSQCA